MLNYGLSSPSRVEEFYLLEPLEWWEQGSKLNFAYSVGIVDRAGVGGPKQQELRTPCLGRSILSQMIEFGSHFTRMNQLKQAHDPFWDTSWSHPITWRRRHIPSCQLGIEFGVRFSKIIFQRRAQRTKVVCLRTSNSECHSFLDDWVRFALFLWDHADGHTIPSRSRSSPCMRGNTTYSEFGLHYSIQVTVSSNVFGEWTILSLWGVLTHNSIPTQWSLSLSSQSTILP